MALLRLHQDEALAIARSGPLVVAIFYGSPTLAHLEAMKAIEDRIIGEYGKLSLLVVGLDVLDGIRITDDVRARSAEIARDLDSKTRGTAFVLPQPGFTGVMLRAFLAALSLVVKTKSPQKTFASVGEGIEWLRELPGQLPDVAQDVHLAVQIGAFVAQVAPSKVA